MKKNLQDIVALCKRRWFVYPWSEIYWWLANAWDFWHYWFLLKKNISDYWIDFFIKQRNDIYLIDTAILMNQKVWQASWHTDNFSDPLIDDKNTWERFRADKLIEEFLKTLPKDKLVNLKNLKPETWSLEEQTKFIHENILNNPNTWKKANRTNVRKFNLMFKTYQWVIEDEANLVYLRPETAQWIFVNFKNILDTLRVRLPFWVAQIWKAFRNEITPWNFLFRTREFEQMEIEYFVNPDDEDIYYEERKKLSYERWINIWIKKENLRLREHDKDELSHYSSWTTDVEYLFPWWWWEIQWIAKRTNYDLKKHQEYSKVSMLYSDPKTWKRFIPHVIEPSWWLTRAFLTVLIDAYNEETYLDSKWEQQSRIVLKLDKKIAPIKFAILPLLEKNEEMIQYSFNIFNELKKEYFVEIDISWWIWKRYRRQDEIWTPYCITIDYQTLEDWTFTIRDRDTMLQKRIKLDEIKNFIN